MYKEQNDTELVNLLMAGDKRAFTEIYSRYWDKLLYVSGKLLKDIMVAEELVQDVFASLWERRAELQLTGKLEHYLAVAIKYKVMDYQARKHRAEIYASGQQADKADNSTEDWLRFSELRGVLDVLVASLPEKCRLVFMLRQEGYSQKEIAEQLSISENTVEKHVVKALRSIRAGIARLFSVFFSALV